MGEEGVGFGGEWSEIVSPEFRHSPNMVERCSDEGENKQEGRNIEEEDFNGSSASRWTEQDLNKAIIWLLIWALAQHWRAAFVWD